MLKIFLPARIQTISTLVCLAVQYGSVTLAAVRAAEPAQADSATTADSAHCRPRIRT